MSGDCDWLNSRVWVETVITYEAERAAYVQRLQDRETARQRVLEATNRQRRYEAAQAVEDAVSVLGADAVVDLVNAIRQEDFYKIPGQTP